MLKVLKIPSQWDGSFEHPQHMFKLRGKKIMTLLRKQNSSIPTRYHTFFEIDHEIVSTVILLPSAESFKKGCCQLPTNYWLNAGSSLPRKKCGEVT